MNTAPLFIEQKILRTVLLLIYMRFVGVEIHEGLRNVQETTINKANPDYEDFCLLGCGIV